MAMDQEGRVVVLIDMDCFYCQVEEKLNPELQGKPIAVVQYNPWKGGGIIAVNYVARAMGVTRHMRGDEAKEKCPEIQLPSVPCLRGKADISKYRDAGKEVARVLQRFTDLLERASIDEAYLDITAQVQQRLKSLNLNTIMADMMPNTFALGYESVQDFIADLHAGGIDSMDFDYEHAGRLLVGAIIVSEIRAAVFTETGFTCSAGIAHNKILAKLVCGMNKPNKQTILPKHSIDVLYRTLSVKKVKHLGGKFGDTVCEVLKINKMGELQTFSEKELQSKFDEKNGMWLHNIARGIDLEPVQARFNPKSIGCCKQLRGKSALLDLESLRKWLKDLGDEIDDRLEKDALENNRTPRQMVVSFSTQLPDGRDTSSSRSYNFNAEDELCGELFSNKALELVMESAEGVKLKDGESNRKLKAPIKFLGISVGKFEDNTETKKSRKIIDYFSAGSSKMLADKKYDSKLNEARFSVSEKNVDKVDKISVSTEKKNDGKDYILKKFFTSDKVTVPGIKENPTNNIIKDNEIFLHSSLDKQESFFAKLLNRNSNDKNNAKPTTPTCEIMNHGDDSNDTEYSRSTINEEINKSIALFDDDDPTDIGRVSSVRELMNTSKLLKDESLERSEDDIERDENVQTRAKENLETFVCHECSKTVPIPMYDMHADYHLALKLREEERSEVRRERERNQIKPMPMKVLNESNRKKKDVECSRNETLSSISSFFMKVDDTEPAETCTECGKKVPLQKFPEHLDFHEAQKLNRELNKKTTSSIIGSGVKRKRKSASPIKKSKVPCKPIDTFFK